MKEYNIEEVWLQDIAPENKFNLSTLPGGVQSKFRIFSELKRVRNLFWWQWGFEVVGILFAVFQFFRHPESLTVGSVVVMVLFSGTVYFFYISYFRKFLRSINSNQGMNMKDTLQSFLDSLNEYINSVMRIFIILLIINIIGNLIFMIIDFESITMLIVSIVLSVVVYGFYYAVITGWFDFMYKDSITELENAIRNLE